MIRSPRRLSCLLALLGACAPSGADAAPGADAQGAVSQGVAPAAPAPKLVAEPDRSGYDDPAIVCRSTGAVWLFCIAWDGQGDALQMRPVARADDSTRPLYRSATRMAGLAALADADDVLHLVWSEEQDDGGWALRGMNIARPSSPAALGEPSPPATLFAAPGARLLDPQLALDGEGRLLLAWQQVDAEGLEIRASASGPAGGWSPALRVSTDATRNNWSPALTATGNASAALAWDAALDGDHDILLARLVRDGDGRLEVRSRHVVTDTPRLEIHPSIADDGDRTYLAWEVGPENWGREGSVNQLEVALHTERRIEIVAIEGDEVLPLAIQPLDGMNDVLSRNCEQPRLAFEGSGSLMLYFRGLPLPLGLGDPEDPQFMQRADESPGGGLGWRTSIWFSYMTRFDGLKWSFADRHQVGLPGSEGRLDAPIASCRMPGGGLAYAVVGDGRAVPQLEPGRPYTQRELAELANWWKPVTRKPTDVTVALVRKEPRQRRFEVGPPRRMAALDDRAPAAARPAPPARVLPDGTRAQLALGDLHRHTDLSRCSSNWDGPIEDALRYALDVAPLDVLAITDHFEHMSRFDWWRTLKLVDAHDVPGRFVNLRGYERSDPMSGHRNVISGGAPPPLVAYPVTAVPGRDDAVARRIGDVWKAFEGHAVLTIPHTPAGMFPGNPSVLDWRGYAPEFDRLVEVFQGYRGSSEAHDAPRAIPGMLRANYVVPNLQLGMHFGLVASSDHQSSDGAFAGVWTSGLTRAEVFAALHARRTFASTCRGALWTEWNGVPMGGSAAAPAGPTSGLLVEAETFGRTIARIEVLVDGAPWAAREPAAARASERFDVELPAETSRWVMARVVTSDGELMWSSPIRLSSKSVWDGPDGLDGAAVRERFGDVWQPAGGRPAQDG